MVEKTKSIKIHKSTFEKLNKIRNTEKGKVGFDSIINYLINEAIE